MSVSVPGSVDEAIKCWQLYRCPPTGKRMPEFAAELYYITRAIFPCASSPLAFIKNLNLADPRWDFTFALGTLTSWKDGKSGEIHALKYYFNRGIINSMFIYYQSYRGSCPSQYFWILHQRLRLSIANRMKGRILETLGKF